MKAAAFFDIDGTIVRCQTQEKLIQFIIQNKMISVFEVFPFLFWFYLYKLGLIRGETDNVRRRAYALLSRYPSDEIDCVIQKVYELWVRPTINSHILERIKWHKDQNHYLVALSGSLQQFCKLVCDEVGIGQFYGTQLKSEGGCYTNGWEGVILEGQAKADMLQIFARQNDVDLSCSYAYGDKYSDKIFLSHVGHPVVVCPDALMRNAALVSGWEIINCES
jgi:HAD superfamily hydrolase (TIGR01490 family)